MARPKSLNPAYRFHLSGQACCEIDGITFYLGKHGSHDSYARYTLLLRVYQDNGLQLPTGFNATAFRELAEASESTGATMPTIDVSGVVTIQVLVDAYKKHVENRYSKAHQFRETHRKLLATKHLGGMLGLDVRKFGPKALKEIRNALVASGELSRTYTNRIVNEIRSMFRWGVAEELVGPETVLALEALAPLQHGEGAYETTKRKAVTIDQVRATAAKLSPIVRDMLRVQVATGMRPSEVCVMRPIDIDRTSEIWIYCPESHKTAHRGQERIIPIIDDARDAVENYLNRKPDSYLFSPAEAMALHRAKLSSERTGYGSYKKPVDNPRKQPGTKYTDSSYRRAIESAAKKASVPNWTPYQVRHLVGCEVGKSGLELAKALLGHENIRTTEIYSKSSTEQAIAAAKIAPKLGSELNNG